MRAAELLRDDLAGGLLFGAELSAPLDFACMGRGPFPCRALGESPFSRGGQLVRSPESGGAMGLNPVRPDVGGQLVTARRSRFSSSPPKPPAE